MRWPALLVDLDDEDKLEAGVDEKEAVDEAIREEEPGAPIARL